MDLGKKYQRRLKLSLIQKHFGNVEVKYVPERDVYEAYKQGRLIYACYAGNNLGKIVQDITAKYY